MFCDSTSAMRIFHNPVQHSKTKHISLRYHFIKDHVKNGDIELHFVHTQGQLADIFTKALDESAFVIILHGLGMMEMDVADNTPRIIEVSSVDDDPAVVDST